MVEKSVEKPRGRTGRLPLALGATAFVFITVLFLAGSWMALAGGMGRGGMGHGMMGGYGRDMMEWGQKVLPGPGYYQTERPGELNRDDYREIEGLRREIREKRRDLASLFKSENPDRKLIDRKLEELDRLEQELDMRIADYEAKRR